MALRFWSVGSLLYAAYVYYWSLPGLWRQVIIPLQNESLIPTAPLLVNLIGIIAYVAGATLILLETRWAGRIAIALLALSSLGTVGSLGSELAVEGILPSSPALWLLSMLDVWGAGSFFTGIYLAQILGSRAGFAPDLLSMVTQMPPIWRGAIYIAFAIPLTGFWTLYFTGRLKAQRRGLYCL